MLVVDAARSSCGSEALGGPSGRTVGHCPLCIPLSPPSACQWLQEASHSLGTKGERRQDGGQIHTGCESLCAATFHSHCDSSAQSSVRLMLLAEEEGTLPRDLQFILPCPAGTCLPSKAAFPPRMGGAVGLSLGRERSAGGVERPHLQIGCRTVFPCLGYKELTCLPTHSPHSRGGEQEQTGIFGSKNWSDLDREGTANNPRVSLQSVSAVFESLHWHSGKDTAGG